MMRMGMLIDVDHMSERAVNNTLDLAKTFDYPVNSGHNGPRESSKNENGRTDAQYGRIGQLGGMAGLGHGGQATNFVRDYRKVFGFRLMDRKQIAIGTDTNGFFPLPGPDGGAPVVYDGSLTKAKTGYREWDINSDGVAHFGLFPDYIKSWDSAGMTFQEKATFFRSAEYFAQMWHKSEKNRQKVPVP